MNEFTIIREHGPAPTPLSDDVLAKARADLLSEINATPATTNRPVRLRRRAVIIGATVAAAAAVAGVIATTGTDSPAPPVAAKPPVLVEFHMPARPPELNPIP